MVSYTGIFFNYLNILPNLLATWLPSLMAVLSLLISSVSSIVTPRYLYYVLTGKPMISVSPEPRSMPLVLLSFLTLMMADLSLFISIPVERHQSSIIFKANFSFTLDVLVKARSSAYAMEVSVTFSNYLSSGDIYIENKLGDITLPY